MQPVFSGCCLFCTVVVQLSKRTPYKIKRLILFCTSFPPFRLVILDSEFLMDFFLTYRQFLSPIRLCKLLILRFRWALMEDTDERRLVRIR